MSNFIYCIKSIVQLCLPRREIIMTAKDRLWMSLFTKMLINDRWSTYKVRNWTLYNHLKNKVKESICEEKWADRMKKKKEGIWRLSKEVRGEKSDKSRLSNILKNFDYPQDAVEQITNIFSEQVSPKDFSADYHT